MNKNKTGRDELKNQFSNYVNRNKNQWGGFKYYLLAAIGLFVIFISMYIGIRITFFTISYILFSSPTNKNIIQEPTEKVKDRGGNVFNQPSIQPICDTSMLAYNSRMCLIDYLKKGKIINTEQGQDSPYTECVNTLMMNEYFTSMMREYVDFVKDDICGNPDQMNQKSKQWFNARIVDEN